MTKVDNDTIAPLDLVEQLRLVAEMNLAGSFAKGVCAEAADEIERLRERCKAYKGQIEAGAIAIEHLRANRAATTPSEELCAVAHKTKLYAAAYDGWRLVPEAITEDMARAFMRNIDQCLALQWRAMILAAPTPPCSPDRDASEVVTQFATAILHGDDVHRAWLMEAAEAFIAGNPIPPPRDRITQTKRLARRGQRLTT